MAALDELSEFIAKAGSLFVQLHPAAVKGIEPVQYNGKTKRQNLEGLYLRYLKTTMNFKEMMNLAGLSQKEGEEPQPQTTEVLQRFLT